MAPLRGWLDEATLLAGLFQERTVHVSYHSADADPPRRARVPYRTYTGHCPVCGDPVQFVAMYGDIRLEFDREHALPCGHHVRELMATPPRHRVLYPDPPYEEELAALLHAQDTAPPRRARIQHPPLTQGQQDPDELPPEGVIRVVQGIHNCSREAAVLRIQDDRRALAAALAEDNRREMRRRLFASVAPSEQWMPGGRSAAEYYEADPHVVLRGEVMPGGDTPPTGKGDPLVEVLGAADRAMAAIDAVLEEEEQ